MTPQELSAYRAKLFRDASAWKKPDRIPHMSYFVTWKILDAGYKLSEAMSDWDIMEKVVREHQEKYQFDAMLEMGVRNPIQISRALGGKSYIINDEAGTVNFLDHAICEHDELPELTQDIRKFFWEKGMARKYACWADKSVTLEQLQKALDEQNKFMSFYFKITKIMKEEYGLPSVSSKNPGEMGIEFIFNTIRGIRGLAIDMRKSPEKLKDAIEMLNERYFYPSLEALRAMPDGPDESTCFDASFFMLTHTIMNPKQFEEYLWPNIKKVLDLLLEKKKTIRLFLEGSSKRAWPYLKDYPKGFIILHPEQDDVFEVRKELPNIAILGGMPVSLLGSGSKQQCVERAKALCDELGKDGGFMLSQDKMVSFRNDANPENVKAVCDFMLDYRP